MRPTAPTRCGRATSAANALALARCFHIARKPISAAPIHGRRAFRAAPLPRLQRAADPTERHQSSGPRPVSLPIGRGIPDWLSRPPSMLPAGGVALRCSTGPRARGERGTEFAASKLSSALQSLRGKSGLCSGCALRCTGRRLSSSASKGRARDVVRRNLRDTLPAAGLSTRALAESAAKKNNSLPSRRAKQTTGRRRRSRQALAERIDTARSPARTVSLGRRRRG